VISAAIIDALYLTTDAAANYLDQLDWESAQAVPITRYWSGEDAPAGRHAEARLLWSNEALYVRFVANQTERLVTSATPQTDTKTIGLWDRDACEIFIAPDPNRPECYFEFEAAPTGEWIDLGIHVLPDRRETDWEFHSGMTTTARVENDRVVIAMRIPWSASIPKPQAGERRRVNLFRCVGSDPTRGYLAWQPTLTPQPNFHVPEVFGWLRFV
jgi:hypothetical protein